MDQLMDLIGELVISESVVLQNSDLKVPGLNLDNFNKAAAQLASISTDLQNVIMSMRMVPPFSFNVLSESLLHLPLWMIFRHMHINLINVRSTYAS